MIHAHLNLDPDRLIGEIDRRMFGSFVEHLGRAVYTGIYEPGHPTADSNGFRQDVLDLVRELGVTCVRYPGGNFVSGYRWEDGVGPREDRPRRIDLAWHVTETNEFGLDEFVDWSARAGTEIMYAVNLGTRGVAEALDVLEYANVPAGTKRSDARRANGHEQPHDIRMWCLGNEMDGPWQLGYRSAADYGSLASRTAKGMRQLDPRVQLVVCGSSGPEMPTFGDWERVVLEHTFDDVDFISCHAYYEPIGGDVASFLASGVHLASYLEAVIATADLVASDRRSSKRIDISLDEWNVWFMTHHIEVEKMTDIGTWPIAPRLLEDSYSVTDAVVVGSMLITMLNHADRVKSASLAQLVNVIAPIMTEPGGPAWRQTTFFPFALTAARAHGVAMSVDVESDVLSTDRYGDVAAVDAAASLDLEGGAITVFLVNRSLGEAAGVSVDLRAVVARFPGLVVQSALTLSDADITARNTLVDPGRVAPATNDSVMLESKMLSVRLPAVSWTVVTLALEHD
ncbi:MAG TPA: alpha-N-arabinofuranosidase [Galbitalea sp.]